MARPKKEKVEPIAQHGDNYAAVLQGYLNELKDNDDFKAAARDQRNDVIRRAKADGFPPEMVNKLHREAKLALDVRMKQHLQMEAGREALNLYPNIEDYK